MVNWHPIAIGQIQAKDINKNALNVFIMHIWKFMLQLSTNWWHNDKERKSRSAMQYLQAFNPGTSFPWPRSLMGYNSKFLGISGPDRHRDARVSRIHTSEFPCGSHILVSSSSSSDRHSLSARYAINPQLISTDSKFPCERM